MYIKNEAIMSKSFEQLGCSKINIGLAITGKRDDATTISIPFSNPFVLATLFILLNTIP